MYNLYSVHFFSLCFQTASWQEFNQPVSRWCAGLHVAWLRFGRCVCRLLCKIVVPRTKKGAREKFKPWLLSHECQIVSFGKIQKWSDNLTLERWEEEEEGLSIWPSDEQQFWQLKSSFSRKNHQLHDWNIGWYVTCGLQELKGFSKPRRLLRAQWLEPTGLGVPAPCSIFRLLSRVGCSGTRELSGNKAQTKQLHPPLSSGLSVYMKERRDAR